ncbi:MAG: YigZ family protein [Bacteroidales bacterium]|nr:YigZ family protein [Bacteroidales bacterium]
MAEGTYKTIESSSEGLYKEKGSKFIAFAFPVLSEDDAKAKLAEIQKKHHAARHHCWAYKLGNQGERFRCSDDGEPSNSAGKPILGQLEAFGVTNVMVVVVRYFGGILLGVGGLVHAYKEAAKDALTQAVVVEKIIQSCYSVHFSYEQSNAVMNILKRMGCEIVQQTFELTCSVRFMVAQKVEKECVSALQKIAEIRLEDE